MSTVHDPPTTVRDELLVEMRGLAPWHIEVEVTPELSTRDVGEEHLERLYVRRENFLRLIERIYPDGVAGRSVLDCACNCGAYLFWLKEAGAGNCFGFDIREHWIKQARFLAANREAPTDGMRFEVADLYNLPRLGVGPFDVTVFNGIFYHLPDPIHGLRAAADLTRELLIVNTATKADLPDGVLAVAQEGTQPLLSGVYGLNWFPTGPEVIEAILRHLGFPAIRVSFWQEVVPPVELRLGRIEILAARDESLFSAYDRQESGSTTAPA